MLPVTDGAWRSMYICRPCEWAEGRLPPTNGLEKGTEKGGKEGMKRDSTRPASRCAPGCLERKGGGIAIETGGDL
jgi:hypothetical protein